MKKILAVISGLVIIAAVGCQPITPQQAQVIAQQAGTFSAVGWIAADNPSTGAVAAVAGIIDIVNNLCTNIVAGKTYTEVVYPQTVTVIQKQIPAQYQPLAQAASLSFLGAIDLLFALHPDWQATQSTGIGVVNSFMNGVKAGLAMQADNPAIQQARRTAAMRCAIKR